MHNRKVLKTAVDNLDKAKAPAKPKDIIRDPLGQWKYPGQNTRIPASNITMKGVNYPVLAQPNVGQPQMMYSGQEYQFPGADYVDEFPQGNSDDYIDAELTDEEIEQYRKGGYIVEDISVPDLTQAKKGGSLKKYSRSLEATNKLFHESPLLKKAKSKKKKIFDPNSNYFQDGGNSTMEGMARGRMAIAAELGNPAAKRMLSPNPKTLDFNNDGFFDTHNMFSQDNYAIPTLQDKGGNELVYNENPPPSSEDIKFNTAEEAEYFAEHYKKHVPESSALYGLQNGGIPNLPLREGRKAYERLGYTDNDRMAVAAEGGFLPQAQYAGQTPFNHPDAGATNVLFQKPTTTKPNSKYNKNTPVNYQAKLKPVVKDNTRDVTANNAVVAKQVNDYMATDEYKAEQKAKKEAQAAFEKEQWEKYNKMSFGEKVLDRTNAALNQPLLMASNLIMGDQAYIPGMAEGLGDGGPDYDKWLKATGQTRGIGVNDIFSAVNPGNWGGHAGRQYGEGNYLTGAGELGLGLLGLKGTPLMGNQLAKSSAKKLINLEKKLGTESGLLSNASKVNPFAGTFKGESILPNKLQLNKLDDPNAFYRLTKDPENYGLALDSYFNKGVPLTKELAETFPKGSRAWGHRYSGPKWNPKTGKIDIYDGVDNLYKVKDESLMKPYLNFPEEHLTFFQQAKEINPNDAQHFQKHWLKGWKEFPNQSITNTPVKSGIGGMDMSKYEIKNPDYFTQLLNTFDSKALSSTNKKFYKDLIDSVKKQNGLVTERQYNELQRLKTGNFNFGKKAYQEGGSLELDLTQDEIQSYIDAGYNVEDI